MPRRKPRRPMYERPHLLQRDIELSPDHAELDGLRVAHLSDIHCGRMTPESHVRAAVDLANEAEPDLIVMTGDYVCWSRRDIDVMRDQLAGLRAKHVVATLGNHDYYAGGRQVAANLAGLGYQVLRNEHATLSFGANRSMHVVGIDDPVTRRHDLDAAFSRVSPEGYRLVLCHCPEKFPQISERGAELVLSGHTHGGQVNPAGVADRVFRRAGRRYRVGAFERGPSRLYVTPGVGFSGIRVRTGHGTRAEVTLSVLRAPQTDA